MIESIILALLVLFYLMVAAGVHSKARLLQQEQPGYPGLARMGQGALLWPVLLGFELARFATTPMWVDVQEAQRCEHGNPTPREP